MEFEFDLENPLPRSEESFSSLFYIENDHMPSLNYLHSLNAMDSNLTVRREIVSLILHSSLKFDSFSLYLSINYLDRFLSSQTIPDRKPWIFKLVAISCISLALKMRRTEFSVSDIQHEGGFVFDSLTIERMEMLILGALKWRMRSVNPFSFVNYFIQFFKFKNNSPVQALKDRATEIILKAQNDIKLLDYKPSVISAAALLTAADELFPMQLSSFRYGITRCSYVNEDNLLKCYHLMRDVVAIDGYEPEAEAVVVMMTSSSCTPANVLDLHCFSSSISDVTSNSSEIRGLKRKKIEDDTTADD